MCIAALAWQILPGRPVFLLSNRDEFYARQSAPLGEWPDGIIIAGRDCVSGGTWLGMSKTGRWAVITNYREPPHTKDSAKNHERSRGLLVTDYLTSGLSPLVFARTVSEKQQYAGFNLVVGNLEQAVVFGNRGMPPTLLAGGLYTLSNGLISEPWPKMERLRLRVMQEVLPLIQGASGQPIPAKVEEVVWQVLRDQQQAADDQLPITGISPDWEKVLSSIFIQTPTYGTRVSSLLSLDKTGYEFIEKTHPHAEVPIDQPLAKQRGFWLPNPGFA